MSITDQPEQPEHPGLLEQAKGKLSDAYEATKHAASGLKEKIVGESIEEDADEIEKESAEAKQRINDATYRMMMEKMEDNNKMEDRNKMQDKLEEFTKYHTSCMNPTDDKLNETDARLQESH